MHSGEKEKDRLTEVFATLSAVSERVEYICESLEGKTDAQPDAEVLFSTDDRVASSASVAVQHQDKERSLSFMRPSRPRYVDEDIQTCLPEVEALLESVPKKMRAPLLTFLNHYKIMVEFERELLEDRNKVLQKLKSQMESYVNDLNGPWASSSKEDTSKVESISSRQGLGRSGSGRKDNRPAYTGTPRLGSFSSQVSTTNIEQLDEISDPDLREMIQANRLRLKEFLVLQERLACANDNIKKLDEEFSKESVDDIVDEEHDVTARKSIVAIGDLAVLMKKLDPKSFKKLPVQEQVQLINTVKLKAVDCLNLNTELQVQVENTKQLVEEKKNFLGILKNSYQNHPGNKLKIKIDGLISQLKAKRQKANQHLTQTVCQLLSSMEKACSQCSDARTKDVSALKRTMNTLQNIQTAVKALAEGMSEGFDSHGNLDSSVVDIVSMVDNSHENFLLERMSKVYNAAQGAKDKVLKYNERFKQTIQQDNYPYNDRNDQIRSLWKLPPNDDEQPAHILSCLSTLDSLAEDFSNATAQRLDTFKCFRELDEMIMDIPAEMDVHRFDLMYRVNYDEIKESPSCEKLQQLYSQRRNPALDLKRWTVMSKRNISMSNISSTTRYSPDEEDDVSEALSLNSAKDSGEPKEIHVSRIDVLFPGSPDESVSQCPSDRVSNTGRIGVTKSLSSIRPSLSENVLREEEPTILYASSPKPSANEDQVTGKVTVDKKKLPWLPRSSMARYFRFHASRDRPSIPRKFLFYTKGVGVFSDDKGNLVDAEGMPLPRYRKIPGKGCELHYMRTDLKSRPLDSVHPGDMRIGLGIEFCRKYYVDWEENSKL